MPKITNEVIDDRIKDKKFIRISNYINADTKIKLKCLIDGYEWETRPDHIMRCSCHCCLNNSKQISSEIVNDEIMKNKKIRRIGKYVNCRTKTKWKCLIDDYEWDATAFHVKRVGCPRCGKFEKLTNEIIDERIKNRKIIRLGDYAGSTIKIKWKCLVHEYEWDTLPLNILKGHGCPKCSKCARVTNDTIDRKLKEENRSIQRVSDCVNTSLKMTWRCLKDGCEWSALPSNILKGHGCPKCGGNLRLTNEVIDIRLKDSNRDIERVGNYINKTTKIKWKCLKDGHIWETEPRNVLQRKNGCPICKASRSEQQIKSFLINNNIEHIHNHKFEKCRYKNELPFDFYLPTYNLCIEYDGEQHYKSIKHFGGQKKFISRKKIDAIKTKFCHDNNIKLLRIPYWDANKIPQILAENILTSGTIE